MQVMLAVHWLNSAGAQLVVDWPKWAAKPNYFGAIMRVFGTDADLSSCQALLKEKLDAQKKGKGGAKLLDIRGISDVPDGAKITWMYKRHRQPGKNKSPSVIKRLVRRARERGEEPKDYAPEYIETHTLMLVSLSTNSVFPMDLVRVRPTHLDVSNTPNAYGLDVPVPRF